MSLDNLLKHSFSQHVFQVVRQFMSAEYVKDGSFLDSNLVVEDEHEFYVFRVGNRHAILLSCCEQLTHAVFFISNYRETNAMARGGINRVKHLIYNIENYLIRTQTVYDLILKLIDAVFHLTNADSECRESVIIRNLRVKRTAIPKIIKPLRKKLDEFKNARHTIIHHGDYREKDLTYLEMYSVLEESYRKSQESLPNNLQFIPNLKKELLQEIVTKKKKEYQKFNKSLFDLIGTLFTNIDEYFINEEHKLRIVLGKDNAQPSAPERRR